MFLLFFGSNQFSFYISWKKKIGAEEMKWKETKIWVPFIAVNFEMWSNESHLQMVHYIAFMRIIENTILWFVLVK